MAELLSRALDAPAVLQSYSRLVIDCNRPLGAESSIAAHSEYTVIPGNGAVSAGEARPARSDFSIKEPLACHLC